MDNGKPINKNPETKMSVTKRGITEAINGPSRLRQDSGVASSKDIIFGLHSAEYLSEF